MSGTPPGSFLSRHIDLIYKLAVVALIALWAGYPPAAPKTPAAPEPAQTARVLP